MIYLYLCDTTLFLLLRNCLVGENFSIKITNLGTGRKFYHNDYYAASSSELLPIRWMAWESILLVLLIFRLHQKDIKYYIVLRENIHLKVMYGLLL